MRTTLAAIATLLLGLTALAPSRAAGQTDALEIRLASGEGVVVLKSGRTVRGEVVRLGDHLRLTLVGGGEIRIPLADAMVIAESMEEAYELRRDGLSVSQVDDRAALAEWCLQEGLPHRAADQALMLAKIDPNHPKLPRIERLLRAHAKSVATLAARPAIEDVVTHAAATVEASDVDPRAFFAERVHSQVMHGCGAARCHGGTLRRDFQLKAFPIAVRPTADIEEANFAAVRKLVGDGGPKSAAMRYATRAHAGVAGERVRDLLVEWSRLLAEEGSAPHASTAGFSESTGATSDIGASHTSEFVSEPDNPYDPAEFNRRHHGSRAIPPRK